MSAITVEHLPWDSDFFSFPVGRIALPTTAISPEQLKDAVSHSGETLTYVFLPIGGNASRETEKKRSALVELGGKCCDLKTVYRKAIAPNCGESAATSVCASQLTPALEALAYASGWCSRFVTDERLSRHFKPMYLIWLKRELERGKVFVRPDADNPQGMATVSVQDGLGKIGLVAVDAKHCGRGIGSALLKDIDRWLAREGVGMCEVVTQGMNLAARQLYEKSGFRLHSQMEVWHVWDNTRPAP